MYAPLLAHDPAANSVLPTKGPLDYIKRVTSRILTRPTTEKDRRDQQVSGQGHQQAIGGDHPKNLLEQEDDKSVNVNQPEVDFHDVGHEQTIGHCEIVKRIVHQSDFLLSRPGHCVDNPKDFITHKSSEELGCSA
ncbi:hypothetical protein MKW94_001467 [Papaver nudicaule]|uniref:Uncharacterized protein n=1 Tax=Papaver nudicaule TaxID=74823 RepID=A0AA41SKK9_PAPNU|nr:hypothetical protein [Papaver nudicaule]